MRNFLYKLVQIKSVNSDYQQLKAAIDMIESRLMDTYKFVIERYEQNRKPSIVIHNGRRGDINFDVILSGHLDVVPAEDNMFKPYIEDEKLYGRGASDMKGVTVAMIKAFEEYDSQFTDGNNSKKLKIALMLTTDEEKGGFHGTKYLVDDIGYSSNVVFLPDTGRGDWSICTDEKGIIWLKAQARGLSAHGARPWLGDNAIEKILSFAALFKKEFYTKYGQAKSEKDYRPTLNFGVIHGGETPNLVPETAFLRCDIRFTNGHKKEDFIKLAEQIGNSLAINIQEEISGPSNSTPFDNYYVDLWSECVKEVTGINPVGYKSSGASDARFFSAKRIPVVMCKPKSSDPHINNEWIDLKDLERFKTALLKWLNGLA